MARDLREMFEKERSAKKYSLKEGHEDRFLAKLDQELPEGPIQNKTNRFGWWRIAASVLVLLGVGGYLLSEYGQSDPVINPTKVEKNVVGTQTPAFSLGDLSPDLKKIESYYVTQINLALSDLEFGGDNKALIDGYMEKLAELDLEYARLNEELNSIGPNDQTINALIKNLQLRLQLLQKLKSKLNQLKSSKNEQEQSNII